MFSKSFYFLLACLLTFLVLLFFFSTGFYEETLCSNRSSLHSVTENNFPSKIVDEYREPTWFHSWTKAHEKGPGLHKYSKYFYPYSRHFGKFRNKKPVVMEIGVQSGGSTRMWLDYFGPGLQYYGFDIDPNCTKYASPDEGIRIFIVDQSDETQLEIATKDLPAPDIVIDDGGHYMKQQIITFQVLYPKLKSGGVYLCEDLHSSYMRHYGGGYKSPNSFVEYSKNWVDFLNARHDESHINRFSYEHKTMGGVAFYDSMVFVEKMAMADQSWERVTVGTDWMPNVWT